MTGRGHRGAHLIEAFASALHEEHELQAAVDADVNALLIDVVQRDALLLVALRGAPQRRRGLRHALAARRHAHGAPREALWRPARREQHRQEDVFGHRRREEPQRRLVRGGGGDHLVEGLAGQQAVQRVREATLGEHCERRRQQRLHTRARPVIN